ncbi:adenylosuccinate lyase [Mariniflexile litorale]|uniref:Adenylosuccinate lyase n=1 Tax=Mariniflexile litorale TaxID=3045158 RepID=A0AAU7ECV2_9FLAO|nr:adenylosuccinate lyase [Mariniflexile sp. KMM 9835]MDQ8212953.1 adenylosuccinate lyase [Mariniflexile sp. KMM 9835]
MSLEEFYDELNYVDASRKNRLKYAHMVLNDISLLPKLIDIMFRVDDKISCRAAWVFEFVCDHYIYAIVPYLDVFCNQIKNVYLDSAVRPVAKVCCFIAQEYDSKHPNTLKKTLKPKHKEQIIEVCFDWMISDQKIAAKAYAMDTLFILGKNYSWVHPQLTQILEQDFQMQSAGYKVRAKRILKKLNK